MARMIDRRLLGPGLAVALLLGACNAATPSPPLTEAPASSATAGASDGPSGAAEAGQTDTDWGRIWDALPEAFPVFPGATAADDAAVEPASGTFALEDADPRAVASWMQTELERAAYRTEALNGPFEDGSYILELVGAGECRIEVAVGPLGGLVAVTVRYGAACPSP
jgi:hypothetical protein